MVTKVLLSSLVVFGLVACGGDAAPPDHLPPNLILSLRDAGGESATPAADSAYAIIVADEKLRANSSGAPDAYFRLDGPALGTSGGRVEFLDDSRTALKVSLYVAAGGNYRLYFEIPDSSSNVTKGSFDFSTRGAIALQQSPLVVTNAYVEAPTYLAQNGQWIPANAAAGNTNANQPNFNIPQVAQSQANSTGAPIFYPPLILNRVKGPNYTWTAEWVYGAPCPIGYYCPPINEVAPPAPVPATHNLEGLAGAIIKLCWELDCGTQLAESLINRGIRGFFRKPGG